MMNSYFIPKQFTTNSTPLAEGNYRVRINQASLSEDEDGNIRLEVVFDLSGKIRKLWYGIIISLDDDEAVSNKLNNLFQSFGISSSEEENFDSWVGKMGAVRVKPTNYCGKTVDRVVFCLSKEYQKRLPAWKEVVYGSRNRDK